MTASRTTGVPRAFSVRAAIVVWLLAASSVASAQTSPGTVAEVRVHGNHTTPDADILGIVGEVIGKPATDQLIAEVQIRLERSGRFDDVDVRKRYRSIENLDDVLLMVVVNEVPGVDPLDLTPSPVKQFWRSGMFMPILHSEDGYGAHLRHARRICRTPRPAQSHHDPGELGWRAPGAGAGRALVQAGAD